MTGCEAYQTRRLERFNTSLKKLIKSHYRKNERARDYFLELVEYYIEQLRENPGSNSFSEDEGFPKGTYREDLKFRKIRFNAPELQGASQNCRLMYIVNESRCIVYLMWIYTHEEFPKRPPDKDLKIELLDTQQQSEESQA